MSDIEAVWVRGPAVLQAIKDARREALEEACRAVCWRCAQGHPVKPGKFATGTGYRFYHDGEECRASLIRRLLSQPKGETDNADA